MRRRRTWRWVAWLGALAVSAALGATAAAAAADQVEQPTIEVQKQEKRIEIGPSASTLSENEWD